MTTKLITCGEFLAALEATGDLFNADGTVMDTDEPIVVEYRDGNPYAYRSDTGERPNDNAWMCVDPDKVYVTD